MFKLYFLIFLFFFVKDYEIINNPYLIGSGERPFLLSTKSADYNYVISSQQSFKLKREEGIINATFQMTDFSYSSKFIHVEGKGFKNFIIDKENNTFYAIFYEESIDFKKGVTIFKFI